MVKPLQSKAKEISKGNNVCKENYLKLAGLASYTAYTRIVSCKSQKSYFESGLWYV